MCVWHFWQAQILAHGSWQFVACLVNRTPEATYPPVRPFLGSGKPYIYCPLTFQHGLLIGVATYKFYLKHPHWWWYSIPFCFALWSSAGVSAASFGNVPSKNFFIYSMPVSMLDSRSLIGVCILWNSAGCQTSSHSPQSRGGYSTGHLVCRKIVGEDLAVSDGVTVDRSFLISIAPP